VYILKERRVKDEGKSMMKNEERIERRMEKGRVRVRGTRWEWEWKEGLKGDLGPPVNV
jgi:hypothetical protein